MDLKPLISKFQITRKTYMNMKDKKEQIMEGMERINDLNEMKGKNTPFLENLLEKEITWYENQLKANEKNKHKKKTRKKRKKENRKKNSSAKRIQRFFRKYLSKRNEKYQYPDEEIVLEPGKFGKRTPPGFKPEDRGKYNPNEQIYYALSKFQQPPPPPTVDPNKLFGGKTKYRKKHYKKRTKKKAPRRKTKRRRRKRKRRKTKRR
jgi:hypothetical protein